jgi:hypothetical protein
MTEPSAGRNAAFAVALMMPFLLVLTYGLAGSTGNSLASGIAIASSITLLAALAHKQPFIPDLADLAFAAIAIAAVTSSAAAALPAIRNEAIRADADAFLLCGCAVPDARRPAVDAVRRDVDRRRRDGDRHAIDRPCPVINGWDPHSARGYLLALSICMPVS